ncbi:hypothetical protein niasHT_024528 [Heterodera trifolii]|uniref:Uncharacterized protein n=1 Tax=Heterodera trifolii TaxID=157864 RepID=A0ABD2K7A0_9BILA
MITDNCKQSEDSGGGGGTMVGTDDGTMAEKVPQSEEASEMIDRSKSNNIQNDLTKTSGHTMARRASFSEAKAGDGQCRKRSNEPIKRKSHEKQHRKSTGDEIIEQRLAALAKENNALKSQLEEQIRLNSVIVANPSLASLGNPNLPRIVFANGNGEQSSSSFGNIMPNFTPFSNSNDESAPFCALQKSERSAFSVIRPGANVPTQQPPAGSCQQNEQNDVQVQAAFNAANAFVHSQQNNSSEFARLAAQLAPFSLFPSHPFGTLFPPPPPPSLCSPPATVFRAPATVTAATAEHGQHTVEEERSNGNQTENATTQQQQQQQQQQNDQKNQVKMFTQMHSNRSSFPNLSMFSNLSDHLLESKAIASSVTDVHSTGEECPLDFSKRGQQKQHQHLSLSSSSFSSSFAAGMRPKSVIISTSQQNDTVAAASGAHLNLAPPAESIGQMLSKGESQAKQQQQTAMANNNNNKSRKVPKRRSPSSDALTRCSAAPADAAGAHGGAGHWTPVIQQYKHGPSQHQQQQMGTASSSSVGIGINNNAKQLKNVQKNVMELAGENNY